MPEYQKELMEYRLQTAKEKLHSAKILLDAGVISYFQKEYVKTGEI